MNCSLIQTHSRVHDLKHLNTDSCFSISKSLGVATMPAKKTTTKRKSEAVVEDEKGPKKVKGKILTFKNKVWLIPTAMAIDNSPSLPLGGNLHALATFAIVNPFKP